MPVRMAGGEPGLLGGGFGGGGLGREVRGLVDLTGAVEGLVVKVPQTPQILKNDNGSEVQEIQKGGKGLNRGMEGVGGVGLVERVCAGHGLKDGYDDEEQNGVEGVEREGEEREGQGGDEGEEEKPNLQLLAGLYRDYTFLASAYLLEPCYLHKSQGMNGEKEGSGQQEGEYGLGRQRLPACIARPLARIAELFVNPLFGLVFVVAVMVMVMIILMLWGGI